jgi:hypothetical protein
MGVYNKRKSPEAIDNEEWEDYTEYTLQEEQEDRMVRIVEFTHQIKNKSYEIPIHISCSNE